MVSSLWSYLDMERLESGDKVVIIDHCMISREDAVHKPIMCYCAYSKHNFNVKRKVVCICYAAKWKNTSTVYAIKKV